MGYAVLGLAYAVGGAFLGAGIYLVISGSFPGWCKEWMLRPVAVVTPAVARFLGSAAIALGASVVAIGFSTIVPELVGGILVLVAITAYLIGVGLFAYGTLLSRRVAL
ncbi:MAG: hypothetical protein M3R21_09420 [Candidatus Dormibacteraeota bacterium]|nr:hypothetical protein [Candidatus Dormibacteraeota bacterium]